MREYTIAAVISVGAVVGVEARLLRTGLLRSRAYWIALAICFGFMLAVNGWLTKLSAPVVLYDERRTTGWRAPWDIPVEDYLFGYALLTLTMVLWDAAGARRVTRSEAAVASGARGRS
jgi:lycopene cyclase domain-containing protein